MAWARREGTLGQIVFPWRFDSSSGRARRAWHIRNRRLLQQPKYRHAVRRRGKHLAVRDHRRNEFVARPELIPAICGLIAVI
jgi:hypothetical protein